MGAPNVMKPNLKKLRDARVRVAWFRVGHGRCRDRAAFVGGIWKRASATTFVV